MKSYALEGSIELVGQRAELKALMEKRRKRWKKGHRKGGKRHKKRARAELMDQ